MQHLGPATPTIIVPKNHTTDLRAARDVTLSRCTCHVMSNDRDVRTSVCYFFRVCSPNLLFGILVITYLHKYTITRAVAEKKAFSKGAQGIPVCCVHVL